MPTRKKSRRNACSEAKSSCGSQTWSFRALLGDSKSLTEVKGSTMGVLGLSIRVSGYDFRMPLGTILVLSIIRTLEVLLK